MASAPTPELAASTASRVWARPRFIKTKVASLAVAGTLLGTTGLAAAGVLPDPVQDAAHRILSTVGINVPSASDEREPGADDEGGDRQSGIADTNVSEGDDTSPSSRGAGDEDSTIDGVIDPGTDGNTDDPVSDHPGNGTPPDDPGNGNGNPPDDPGNGNLR
jgi:hypothetical protein